MFRMPHGFDMHRVFIAAPGDLEEERRACHSSIAHVNEIEGLPFKTLLAPVGLVDNGHIVSYRSAVSQNVKDSAYYIQIFEDEWGPNSLFRKVFQLAIDCRDDPTRPMQEVVVFLKAAPRETDPAILAFRQELEERRDVPISAFANLNELNTKLTDLCTRWIRSKISESKPG